MSGNRNESSIRSASISISVSGIQDLHVQRIFQSVILRLQQGDMFLLYSILTYMANNVLQYETQMLYFSYIRKYTLINNPTKYRLTDPNI